MSEIRLTATRPEFWVEILDNGEQRLGAPVVASDIAGYRIMVSAEGADGLYTPLQDEPANENGNLLDIVIRTNPQPLLWYFKWAAIDRIGNIGEFTPPVAGDARVPEPTPNPEPPPEPKVVSSRLGVPSGVIRFVP